MSSPFLCLVLLLLNFHDLWRGEDAVPILDDLELPIKKRKIDGPAVRSLATRKEDNNGEPATIEKFRASYASIKDKVFAGLKTIGSIRF
jgi:hypothetical protein